MSLQISVQISTSAAMYIQNQGWRSVQLSGCPLHSSGGCSFARHGSYGRVTPRGLRIARWYCSVGHQTFSLLPDFLAAGQPGLLASVEDSVAVTLSAQSIEAVADRLRGPDITLPSAVRWLRRRIRAIRAALHAVTYMVPDLPIGAFASGAATGGGSGQTQILLGLRRSLPPPILSCIPAPLGFLRNGKYQHGMGPDEGGGTPHYGGAANRNLRPCSTNSIKPPP